MHILVLYVIAGLIVGSSTMVIYMGSTSRLTMQTTPIWHWIVLWAFVCLTWPVWIMVLLIQLCLR